MGGGETDAGSMEKNDGNTVRQDGINKVRGYYLRLCFTILDLVLLLVAGDDVCGGDSSDDTDWGKLEVSRN